MLRPGSNCLTGCRPAEPRSKLRVSIPTVTRQSLIDAVLLTDYKVLVLTVDEKYIAGLLQLRLADDKSSSSSSSTCPG